MYFITICTQNRENVFGKIKNGKMMLNEFGDIAEAEWIKSEEIRKEIKMDEYMIMPNHIHGIVEIIAGANVGANGRSPVQDNLPVGNKSPVGQCKRANPIPKMQSGSISSLISGFKSSVTKKINKIRSMPREKMWQRNYWEHIIRDENEYYRISEYIKNNPLKWDNDKLNDGNGNIIMEP